jgi:hypothetical protein
MIPADYRLTELVLLLPVAMKIVEWAFLAIKIIKTEFHNKMSIMSTKISA